MRIFGVKACKILGRAWGLRKVNKVKGGCGGVLPNSVAPGELEKGVTDRKG